MANPNPPRENLRPWKPGQSGNPAGGSRKLRVTSALLALLDEKNGTADRALATKWLTEALKGDPKFFAMLLDRVEGKVVQPIVQVSDDEPDPLTKLYEDGQTGASGETVDGG